MSFRTEASRSLLAALLLGIVIAFVGLGWRGIWDPDEGRYTNVALHMLATGDYLHPRRHHETKHWTKPPLTYWAIAAAVAAFGPHPAVARLPAALAFIASIALVFSIARILIPGCEGVAAVVYATSVLPLAASQIITTDFLLATSVTLAVYGYVRARFAGDGGQRSAIALMWAGFGLGFLTKGPPALLPLAAIVAFHLTSNRARRLRLATPEGLALFAAIALPWYVLVIAEEPRLLSHFLGQEVVARIASDEHRRHGQWYGWFMVYVPTLLIGTLPWTADVLRTIGAHGRAIRLRWQQRAVPGRPEVLWFLLLWFALPLAVFCLARSRLPLYLLPLFAPLALLVADTRLARNRGLPPLGWLVAWAMVLLALNAAIARMPNENDASAWAEYLRRHLALPIYEVVFVEDTERYGLHLALGAQVERISLDALDPPAIKAGVDMDLARELSEREPKRIWITTRAKFPEVAARLQQLGCEPAIAAPDFYGRAIFRIEEGCGRPQARPARIAGAP